MKEPFEVIASGAIVASMSAEKLGVQLLTVGQPSTASVRLRLLDESRDELGERETNQTRILMAPLSSQVPPILKRLYEALGAQDLYIGEAEFSVTPMMSYPWQDLGIAVTTADDDSTGWMYVERSKHNWGMTGIPPRQVCAFLLTSERIADRVAWIAKEFGLTNTQDVARYTALTHFYEQIVGGYDSPLISQVAWNDANCLEKLVAGTIRNIRREQARQRYTRFGLGRNGREIDNKIDINEVNSKESNVIDDVTDEFRRDWEVLLSMISEYSKNDTDYLLYVHRFVRGLPIKRLAADLKINYQTARVKIHRARKYILGADM